MQAFKKRGGNHFMTNKEKIIEVLKKYKSLTQREISFHIFGDYKHDSNIYSALMALDSSGMVVKTGKYPAYYSIVDSEPHLDDCSEENETTEVVVNQYSGNVILLNKPFLGGWLDSEGNIGHEIIDFLLADDGNSYVYNNPRGACPDNIWVDGTTDLNRLGREKYLGKYMVLTSEKRGSVFDILYVIELSEKLHRFHTSENDKVFRENQRDVKNIIRNRKIKYNGKFLDEIYQEDDTLYLTFKSKKIYKAINPISVTGLTYNFQRNKGYLYDDDSPEDYGTVKKIIEDSIKDEKLKEITPRRVDCKQIGLLNADKTFINLIKQEENEQIFTNILHSVLSQGDLLKHFCEKFKRENQKFDSSNTFSVLREVKVVDGRIDICAESEYQRVIIENKINSGLNGINPKDNISQLTTYYKWGHEKVAEPLCFIVAPDYRKLEIEREIHELDQDMENVYSVKTYGDIASFLSDEYKKENIPRTYAYYQLIPEIIKAFKNLSYSTKEDLYARMFLDATNEN